MNTPSPTPAAVPEVLACPRCDGPLRVPAGNTLACVACQVEFPRINGIPWLFAEPAASLGEWQGRLHAALERLRHERAGVDAELAGTLPGDGGHERVRARLARYGGLLDRQRQVLTTLLSPLDIGPRAAAHETYLALRTRLPSDQGLNTYHANVHRDWAWGDAENAAALAEIEAVLGEDRAIGVALVLGAGSGRLAWDCHRNFETTSLTALDFNPLLVLVAQKMFAGETLEMVEFPLAPLGEEDDAVLRVLAAPAEAPPGLHLVLGDASRPPFAAGRFDTVLTPWLIDIVDDELPSFAARVNRLLKPGGRWINFGSLAFAGPRRASRHTPADVADILAANGFAEPVTRNTTIPYLCSPASRHGRRETVFTFAAGKSGEAADPGRHRALPDWLVTGREPVPLTPAFQSKVLSTRIHAHVMSLIDGRRSIRDMARMLEEQRLMAGEEALPAIRNFLIRMYEDATRGN